ncbi:calexcitin-2 isoform X1 [Eurytemora carolleeae]|uniref:calexcitin-2 isoform X1 n=1 Tax=Eurytemora carolleeae TaxID=1294199 RepID=UPI000C76FB2D|nr:calexcitin-2 isoform X1 [Eurytemora carolleeae]|eukprot:XP_023349795.1 calexcitin-2-like isoform X1 [Eurytemora affinis]
MGNVNVRMQKNKDALSGFQIAKLTFDFNTFFDLNKDGYLSYKDFQWAKDKVCFMSGWKIDSEKYRRTEKLFSDIWISLLEIGDMDNDGRITIVEWLQLWERYKKELCYKERGTENFLQKFYTDKNPDFRLLKMTGEKLGDDPINLMKKGPNLVDDLDTILPSWLHEYLVFRFDLLDRTGDGRIDTEEYEYVLSEFGIRERDARQAFLIFTQNSLEPLSFERFVNLFEEYYLSDNPSDLGNFVNGVLEFKFDNIQVEAEEEDEDDLLEEYSAHKEDDLMNNEAEMVKHKEKEKEKTNKFKKIFRRIKKSIKLNCLQFSSF